MQYVRNHVSYGDKIFHVSAPYRNWKFEFLKIQDGGRTLFAKKLKSPYLRKRLSYRRDILHTDAQRKSALY